ncbi:MAG TPA: hypothetical protein VFG04_14060, partial [Planctomycetaceae bacterium]|nr:hypothetical protein [Planctomycetaceae bacterium]
AKRVRPWIGKTRGDWVTAPKPVRPWVWSGLTMNQLLSKHPSEFNIKATATTKRQQVKVPLPVPHPVTTDHAGELGRLRDDEFKAMHQVAFDYIMDSLRSGMNMKRRTRLAWRIEADRIIETRTEQAA